MSQTSSGPRPTPPQLRYLRSLASLTGTTFSPPETREEASREIQRLLELKRRGSSGGFAELERVEVPVYATGVRDDEITGYGSTARWKTTASPSNTTRGTGPESGPPTEVGRYTVKSGERVIYGQRVNGRVTLQDRPAGDAGRSYVIERDLQDDGYSALKALVADYIEQAQELDQVPMASSVIRRDIEAGRD